MRLIRALLALAVLSIASGLNAIARWLLEPVSTPRTPLRPAERMLLGSLVGVTICVFWIWISVGVSR
jgi:hypothetical protein